MKIRSIVILVAVMFAMALPMLAAAEGGAPDTMVIMTNRPEAGVNESLFVVELWVWNDADGVAPQFGFTWDSELLNLDSARASAAADAAFDQFILYDGNNITTSNTNNRAVFAGISFFGNTLPASPNRTLIATYYFTLASWTASDMIKVDSSSWDAGSEMIFVTPTETFIPVFSLGEGGVTVRDPSDVGDQNGLPAVYSLSQNYPNPFNPETVIEFSLEQAGDYTFTVYNVIGQVVDEIKGMGAVGNNEVRWNGANQSSGVYFYKLQAGNFTETKKMMLVK